MSVVKELERGCVPLYSGDICVGINHRATAELMRKAAQEIKLLEAQIATLSKKLWGDERNDETP